ncbi:hypothetical protein KIF59_14280 [Enterobacter cloacae subsp. cloacae]|nr:hypothetical protein [Enterobacter cloacae subsp. cloacae]
MKVLTGIRLIHLLTPVKNRKFFGFGETEDQFGKGTLTVWTAFTDSTIENGCLEIMLAPIIK